MATINVTPRGEHRAQVRLSGAPHLSKTFSHKRDAQLWARRVEDALCTLRYCLAPAEAERVARWLSERHGNRRKSAQ